MTAASSDAAAVVGALALVHKIILEGIDGDLRAEVGVSLAQFEVLFLLYRTPESRLRMVDCATQMCVSRSGVTQLVDKLEEAGFVAREPSRRDRRLTYAVLTGAGRQAAERGWRTYVRLVQRRFGAHVTDTDLRCMQTALANVLAGNGFRVPPTTA